MKIYNIKISIIGIPGFYAVLEVTDNSSFKELHESIFEAFDRDEEHLYSFYITKKDTKNVQLINKSLQIADPQAFGSRGKALLASKTKLKDIGFLEKDIIHYLFDFGEMWWHRIRFQSISELNNQKKYIKIMKEFG